MTRYLDQEPFRKIEPIFKQVVHGLPADLAEAMRRDPTILRSMIAAGESRRQLLYGMFNDVPSQIDLWDEFNWEMKWGLPSSVFNKTKELWDELGRHRGYKLGKQRCWTVVPYLESKDKESGLMRTFRELWKLAEKNFLASDNEMYSEELSKLRILGSEYPEPGLRIELLDWQDWMKEGAKVDKARYLKTFVLDKDDKEIPAHLAVMAAAVMHPEFFKNFSCLDKAIISGLTIEVTAANDTKPQFVVPGFEYSPDGDTLKLRTISAEFVETYMNARKPLPHEKEEEEEC